MSRHDAVSSSGQSISAKTASMARSTFGVQQFDRGAHDPLP
ncbi:hypothetical protein [Saccharopolyspora thermophila]|nr:hypothetical protein [Saccharopolyspora subtropica]